MKIQLTDEQAAAVFAPVRDNLVSAAAGSGKTKVLSERIAQRIKSGDTSIDRLLIVTFTRAAAAQMKERISKALDEEYAKTKNTRIKRQAALVGGADICTIDSFCINLVKRNFFRIGIAPDFDIADDNEMAILKEEIITDVLEEMYEKGEGDFLLLAESVGHGKNDDRLKEIILKIYEFTRAFPDPNEWLDKAVNGHIEGTDESNMLFEFIEKEIDDRLKDLEQMLLDAFNEAEYAGIDSYAQVFAEEIKKLRECRAEDKEEFGAGIAAFEFGSFVGKKVDASLAEEKEYLRGLHNDAKALFAKIKQLFEMYDGKRGVSHDKIAALVRCVKSFANKYAKEKFLRRELEFSDCEYFALKILQESEEARSELQDKYDEIYIDEYQDTNVLQDALFTMVSRKERGEPNVFIVGDIKQSIYKFRHSDPMLFGEKTKTFGADESSAKMLLTRNFRSRSEVLDSVNCVFEKVMREGTAQVEYDEEHILKCGAKFEPYGKNKSELYVLDSKSETEDETDELLREQREALVVAKRIREMMDEGFEVSEDGKMRPMKYSDVAVLLPALKSKADMVSSVFALMDIPMFCTETKSFFDNLEIRTVIAALKVTDNPLNDIELAALLRSPIFGFSENELMEIRTNGRDKPFFENIVCESEKESATGEKCKGMLETLESWRKTACVTSVEKFLTKLVDETGYYSFVGTLPGGNARRENIRKLLSVASGYEKKQYKGLYNFVRYIDKTVETGGNIEAGNDRAEDTVFVTTIHKSKGLEFPIVFVMGCGNKFNDRDASEYATVTPKGGIAISERDAKRRIRFVTPEYRAISMMIVRENHAERMRLLYVAMTRAKEKLVLVGSTADFEKKNLQWLLYRSGKKMSDYRIREINNYLDYVCSGADEKYWDIHKVERLPDIVRKAQAEKTEAGECAINDEVMYRLSYVYPYDEVKNVPSKMSVSEIKKMSMDDGESVKLYDTGNEKRLPSFVKPPEKLVGNERGTAYHKIMELLDPNETDVAAAIERFKQKGFVTQLQAECIDTEKIRRFLASPLAEQMRRARRIWREESFTIEIDARDVFENGGDEKICVQGTIDCFFEGENGETVLVDYKTDFYKKADEIAERYKKQLELYELAVFERFLKKCDKKCLYLFHNDDIIEV